MALRVHSPKKVTLLLLLVAGLLTGCGNDAADEMTTPSKTEEKEIRLNADSWQMMDGNASTRVTTFDNATALQTEGAFTCSVYNENATTIYDGINAVHVNWNNTTWVFSDGTHNWPDNGNLDFFAYMPATKPDYITAITYDVSGSPAAPHLSFTCDMTQTIEKEFVYALTTGQNKTDQGTSGVTMTFKHPFTRIIFHLTNTDNVTVNSISIAGLFTTGTYTHGTGWSSTSGSGSLNGVLDTPYIVIPNNYGSKTLTVNATWEEWGDDVTADVSASVAFDWAAGTSYTYNLTLSKYALKVDTSKYTEQW